MAFQPETWRRVFDVLKPGAHMLAFSGTRTYHRMVCAIEDAGFEIRDQIGWAYGTGFPKSHDVSKAIDKAAGATRKVVGSKIGRPGYSLKPNDTDEHHRIVYRGSFTDAEAECAITEAATPEAAEWEGFGTALKPGWEPICVARKPLSEPTIAANVLRWRTGALNIDASRIEAEKATGWGGKAAGGGTWGETNCGLAKDGTPRPAVGRWPANLIHDGSPEVLALFPQSPGQQGRARNDGAEQGNAVFGALRHVTTNPEPRGDFGSAARFFYCAKASAADRAGSSHPTVKPLALMRYLCTLVTPPGGHVLDPFAGSGTTLQAAIERGFSATGIEIGEAYAADIRDRLGLWLRGNEHVSEDELLQQFA